MNYEITSAEKMRLESHSVPRLVMVLSAVRVAFHTTSSHCFSCMSILHHSLNSWAWFQPSYF